MSHFLDEVRTFARERHKDQIDDDGLSYYQSHLGVVAALVGLVTTDEEVIAAAYLHDVVEDTNTTEEELRQVFGDKVADLVMEVTHEGSKDLHGYYFPRLKSKDAIMIKFADRLSNLSRMGSWDNKRVQHYLKRSKFWKSEGQTALGKV